MNELKKYILTDKIVKKSCSKCTALKCGWRFNTKEFVKVRNRAEFPNWN